MKIIVGSTNPVKVNAVKLAAKNLSPNLEVIGVEVQSGINEQPLSDLETKTGAINRAKAVLALKPRFDLGIGLEGGVFQDGEELWSTVWAAVVDQRGELHTANGARFLIPKIIAQSIMAGKEMGPLMAELVQEADIRKKQGMIGVITKNFITRTEEYAGIIKMALGLWHGKDWYVKLQS